ncbi:hypothetical protein BKA67DRAFT_541844 [Truncatella angustata]|uniref:Uncharacterized protein n=1 Tax=Truncatella angustata TaxID=152316 RepID=A0A9P8RH27_9PEZI|nr:uncharacterized protein BKA67DRAFT_541844 [Truncatella angustata]KAH6645674.1 hypothetical protein BKA67DRAFT_541844 [Truncatella angustata]
MPAGYSNSPTLVPLYDESMSHQIQSDKSPWRPTTLPSQSLTIIDKSRPLRISVFGKPGIGKAAWIRRALELAPFPEQYLPIVHHSHVCNSNCDRHDGCFEIADAGDLATTVPTTLQRWAQETEGHILPFTPMCRESLQIFHQLVAMKILHGPVMMIELEETTEDTWHVSVEAFKMAKTKGWIFLSAKDYPKPTEQLQRIAEVIMSKKRS